MQRLIRDYEAVLLVKNEEVREKAREVEEAKREGERWKRQAERVGRLVSEADMEGIKRDREISELMVMMARLEAEVRERDN